MIRGSITVTIPFTISGGIEAKLTQKKFKTLAKEAFTTVLSDTSEALLKIDSLLHENQTEGKFVAKPAVFNAEFQATTATVVKVAKAKPIKKVKASPAPKKVVKAKPAKKVKSKKVVQSEELEDDSVEELD